MHQEKPAVLAHRRERWMRPDAERYLRADWRSRKYWSNPPPGFDEKSAADTWSGKSVEAVRTDDSGLSIAELRSAQARLAHLRWLLADLKFDLTLRRLARKYRPDQPRVPAGSPDSGQWTDAGGGGSERGARDGGGEEGERPGGSPQTSATLDSVQVAVDNQRQNKMVRDISVQLRLSKDQQDQLHREISGQGYGYHEILQRAKDMFGK